MIKKKLIGKITKAEQIVNEYKIFIGKEIVDKFGGSYQTYENLGDTWTQKIRYSNEIKDFIFIKTKLFFRVLDKCYQNNFNMMYKVCNKVANHISPYMLRKSPDLTKENVKDTVLNEIFFDFHLFTAKFKQTYKKPFNISNPNFVVSNPGITAMATRLNMIQR